MKPRTTMALVGALLLLIGGYWALLQTESTLERRGIERQRVFDFEGSDIVKLTVHRIERRPIAAERRGTQAWAIVEPTAIAAHNAMWDRAADRFATVLNERTIAESPEDPAAYGFDEPLLEVTAETEGGAVHTLRFGLAEPTGTSRYARVDDGPIFLTAMETYRELDRESADLRDTRLFYLADEDPVARIVYERTATGGEDDGQKTIPVVMQRVAPDEWRLEQPIEALADLDLVNELANALRHARGDGFIDTPEDLDDYGLSEPGAQVTVQTESGTPQTVLLGYATPEGRVYAKRAGAEPVFTVDGTLIGFLPQTPTAFREFNLLTKGTRNLETIHFKSPYAEFELTDTEDEGWKLTAPPAERTNQMAVSTWIGFLKELAGRDFPGAVRPEFGLDPAPVEVRFNYGGDRDPAVIKVGARSTEFDAHFAMQDTGTVTTIPSDDARRLLEATPFDFQDRGLLRFQASAVQRVELIFAGTAYRFERAQTGDWRVREPEGKRWDSPSDMEALLEALNPVLAKAIEAETAPADPAQYGLAEPMLRATLYLVDGGAEAVVGPLTIGSPAADNAQQRFAMAAGDPRVYRIRQAVIDGVRDALRGIRDQ